MKHFCTHDQDKLLQWVFIFGAIAKLNLLIVDSVCLHTVFWLFMLVTCTSSWPFDALLLKCLFDVHIGTAHIINYKNKLKILNANFFTFQTVYQLRTKFWIFIVLSNRKGNLVHGTEKTFSFNYYNITKVLIWP